MANTDYQSIDEYIAARPEALHAILERVRATIRKALPEAEETISYQIPCFKSNGTPIVYFAGWKQHFSLYPATDAVVETLREDLARYKISRGTIRFPLTEKVPVGLIGKIARLRAKEVAERQKAKAAKPKKRAPAS